MVALVSTVAYLGLEARAVEVQCQIAPGLPAFAVVGLPDKAVGESRERVRAALSSLGLSLPPKRITVNLAPADMQKEFVAELAAPLKLWPTHGDGKWKNKLRIKDSIADITLQQVLTRPAEFDVIATPNLNGDYLSDALAAQVGGIGIAPGANINYLTGHGIFEATHGTAPKYAGLDKVNPSSVILSGVMMLTHLGWNEAAELIEKGISRTIAAKRVTYDFHRLMKGAKLLKCSEFGDAIIAHMA